jgi:AraC family transcriptional regulator, arabinose operon regulatory protein
VEDVTWLNEVREVRHPLDMTHPLIVRWVSVQSGPALPQPSVPFPEKHPYCELSFNFEGKVLQYIGAEKIERRDGDLMLMGPGTPHYATRLSYPHRTVTVHFLPILLFEMGPEGDGARVLARFTTPQKISQRVVRPPAELTKEFSRRFKQMVSEFEKKRTGSELRLRALLMEILVDLLRWEESSGVVLSKNPTAMNWLHVEKVLRYMHEKYADAIYIEQIARAGGLSVSRLQVTFREALGMSCVHYLRALRISHAKALLCVPEVRVTEVALQVGFETLSHFNTSFRSLIGMSPTEFMRSQQPPVKTGVNFR